MNLKTLRQNAHLTQQEVAQDCSLTLRSYQNYESNEREMNYKTLAIIADYFGCSIDYLLGHQTKNTLQLEGLNEAQRKIVDLVKQLTPEQSWFVLGKVSDVLGLPYNAVKPVRPF